jgi:hypothetical protein
MHRPSRACVLGGLAPLVVAATISPARAAGAPQDPPVIASECVDAQGVVDTGTRDASCDPDWALRQTGLARAQAEIRTERHEEPGRGIVIASLDTGYTGHGSLPSVPPTASGILTDRGYAFECDARYDGKKEGVPQPCDPTVRPAADRMGGGLPFMKQPGHGTGTISVLIGPGAPKVLPSPNTNARVSGAAPGALVVPMRTIDGVILWEGRAWNMARAISRVVLDDPYHREPRSPAVDVISMSVGRRAPYSHLEKAVLLAERRGVIVVAAAGQGPRLPEQGSVRFPANYPSVVAVSGVDVNTHPWDYWTAGGVNWFMSAGQGRGVDVAAPAVNVWRAETVRKGQAEEFRIGRGTGTSFATPLVAGAAALWLQWYGRDDLQTRYGRSAISSAFLLHLRTNGVRTPTEMAVLARQLGLPNAAAIEKQSRAKWNPQRMGAGMLAADKLIERRFEDLPTREDVCAYVYEQRGAEGLGTVCPPRDCPQDTHANCAHDSLPLGGILAGALRRPLYHIDPRNAYVFSLTAGAPFGEDEGRWYSPVVSAGLIRSHHQYQNPEGLLVQAKGGEHGFGVGIGYAITEEYGPHRNQEDKYATIPGFGVMLGFSARAGYLRTAGTDHVGVELGFAYTRTKVNVGLYRALGSNPTRSWRWTLDAGFGF